LGPGTTQILVESPFSQRIKKATFAVVKMKSHYITLVLWRRLRKYLEPVMRAIVRNADELPPSEQEEEKKQ